MISHSVSVMTQKRTVVLYHGVHDERSEPKRFYKISRAQRVGVFFLLVSVPIRARLWEVIYLLALLGRNPNYLNQITVFLVGIV